MSIFDMRIYDLFIELSILKIIVQFIYSCLSTKTLFDYRYMVRDYWRPNCFNNPC